MKNSQTSAPSRKIIFLLITIFLSCLILAVSIGINVIHEENIHIIGSPDNNLTNAQLLTYDLTFFMRQKDLQKRNENLQATTINIEMGKPLNELLTDLERASIVEDASLLRKILIYTGADRQILPGNYPISAGSSILEIAHILQDPNASLIDFVVLPGWRMEEIAAVLPTSGLSISPEEFIHIVNQPVTDEKLLALGITGYEGCFFPGKYMFHRNVSPEEFAGTLAQKFQSEISADFKDAFAGQGLSVYQAVILASIIQREAVRDEEKPIMASVFINRLNNGMPLQSDPTVQYALGFSPEWGWWKSPLSFDDLKTESPYNTYNIAGLPPTPISNPDAASLQAVAFPAETSYFYFRALCDGSKLHVFSETLDEHINNACTEAES
jgi:UPF0755 protein